MSDNNRTEQAQDLISDRRIQIFLAVAMAVGAELYDGYMSQLWANSTTTQRIIAIIALSVYTAGKVGIADWILDKIEDDYEGVYLWEIDNVNEEMDILNFGKERWANQEIRNSDDLSWFTIPSTNVQVYICRKYDREQETVYPNWRKVADPAEVERRKNAIIATYRIINNELDAAREINRKLPAIAQTIRNHADKAAMGKVDDMHRSDGHRPVMEILDDEIESYEGVQEEGVELTEDEYDSGDIDELLDSMDSTDDGGDNSE